MSKCYELAKQYAGICLGRRSCLIPEHIRSIGFTTNHDAQFQDGDAPEAFRDDQDDIFDGFFPSDEEEFMHEFFPRAPFSHEEKGLSGIR